MGLTATLSEPLFTGTLPSSVETQGKYNVALDGAGYMIDRKRTGEWRHESVPLLRPQADQSSAPGVQSVNPEDLWRSSITSWHRGAGQVWRNKDSGEQGEVSNPYRFNTSLGVDVWTAGEVSLLNATESKLTSAASNLRLVLGGSYLYVSDDQTLKRTDDLSGTPTWTSITGTPAVAISSVVSTGSHVYTAHGASGVYQSAVSGTTSAVYHGGISSSVLGWAKGRLMSANANVVHNITAAATAAVTFTHPDTSWTWVGFADGRNDIYMAGYSGDKSRIYRTAVQPDGTALAVPVQAGELPDGEIVTGIYGYLGWVVIGTDKGIRFAEPDSAGDLIFGDLIEVLSAETFEGQSRFVWFGWSNYNGSYTGLGRMDLKSIDQKGQPAYASDVMAAAQGTITGSATFDGGPVFAVAGSGVWAVTTDKVASGEIAMGLEDYRLVEDKVATSIVARFTGSGTVSAAIRSRAGTFSPVGTNTQSTVTYAVNNLRASAFEVRLTLNRDASDLTLGPTLDQMILRVYPTVETTRIIVAPLLLWETVEDLNGSEVPLNVGQTLDDLWGLRNARELVQWQEGSRSYQVIVEDVQWLPETPVPGTRAAYQGTALVRLKVIE